MIDRMHRGQLDGVASGGMLCQRLAPTMRVVHIVGLLPEPRRGALRARPAQAAHRSRRWRKRGLRQPRRGRLRQRHPVLAHAGAHARRPARGRYVDLGSRRGLQARDAGASGSRRDAAAARRRRSPPTRTATSTASSASRRRRWPSSGRRARPTSPICASATCSAAWSWPNSAFDPLPLEAQNVVRGAAGRLMRHMEDMGEQQDDALIHSLFEKQGMHRVEVSKTFRTDFLDAARAARLKLGSVTDDAGAARTRSTAGSPTTDRTID